MNFINDYKEADSLQKRGESLGPQDKRTVTDLLIDQVEFCDVLIVNKMDLVDETQATLVKEVLSKLNPRAHIVTSTMGTVPLKDILNTGRFSFEQAQQAPGWLQEVRGEHTPETEEYGISSMVFRSDKPFHPDRYWKFLTEDWPNGIVRSKGVFWVATRMNTGGSWSQAGGQVNVTCAGTWLGSVFKPDANGIIADLPPDLPKKLFDRLMTKPYGDRRQELVFIGSRLEDQKLNDKLEACLVTDEEMEKGPDYWATLHDPIPAWVQAAPPPASKPELEEAPAQTEMTR